MNPLLTEAKRLYDLGYAIHWLKSQSKIPVSPGWTKGPRANWETLANTYKEGMNVGVRLGHVSEINGGHLVVVDFDLKSGEAKHKTEMMAELENLLPGLHAKAPLVASGRANGSGHLHTVTMGPPQSMKLAQSKDIVKVHMPSAWKLSKREQKELAKEEIKKGIRLRPAWEISLMGEGSQVALPPSLHPDSGKRYVWSRRISGANSLPVLGEIHNRKTKVEKSNTPFELIIDVDLKRFALGDEILYCLREGEDFEGNADQSALAYKVAIALVKAGASDQEIGSILVDQGSYALGSVGYRHRQTADIRGAWDWVQSYCVAKARREHDVSLQFDTNCQITPEEEARIKEGEAQAGELDWTKKLDRNKQTEQVLGSVKNIRLILQHAVSLNVFRFNEFSAQMVYGANSPWNTKKKDDAVTDIDPVNVQSWLADHWKIEPAKGKVADAIEQIASENRFHPVKQYILGLEWDGKPRIDSWLKNYLGAQAQEPYLSAISRKVLCAMVARVFVPGIKFDHVLVLEGIQGVGKSTVVNILGGEWTLDATLDLRDKDSVQSMFGRWVVELGELASLRAADLETMKAFISRRVDHIRVSYGRWAQDFPRQCIFIGTTNEEQYLKDSTGERRFWPVKTQSSLYHLAELRIDRDQLFAEAYFAWKECGEVLYLSGKESKAAQEEQSLRAVGDVWVEMIEAFLDAPKVEQGRDWKSFTMRDVFSEYGPIPIRNPNVTDMRRVGVALRFMGYKRGVKRVNGKCTKVWEEG